MRPSKSRLHWHSLEAAGQWAGPLHRFPNYSRKKTVSLRYHMLITLLSFQVVTMAIDSLFTHALQDNSGRKRHRGSHEPLAGSLTSTASVPAQPLPSLTPAPSSDGSSMHTTQHTTHQLPSQQQSALHPSQPSQQPSPSEPLQQAQPNADEQQQQQQQQAHIKLPLQPAAIQPETIQPSRSVDAVKPVVPKPTFDEPFNALTMVKIKDIVYKKLEKIGKGGSSSVYRVQDAAGRSYALKEVDLKKTDDTVLGGYVNEAQLLTSLKVRGSMV